MTSRDGTESGMDLRAAVTEYVEWLDKWVYEQPEHLLGWVKASGLRAALAASEGGLPASLDPGASAAPLDVERLARALVTILGDEEVYTRDGSMGVRRTAPLIAAEYARLSAPSSSEVSAAEGTEPS